MPDRTTQFTQPQLPFDDVPKLCECGCGELAPIATRTYSKRGIYKGQAFRFVKGHQSRMFRPLVERFWEKVHKTASCWLWTGTRTFGGYGTIGSVFPKPDKIIRAHRLSYEIHFGLIPEGLEVCHDCPGGDNPACVNPAHLFLGTHQENMNDSKEKGRNFVNGEQRARGERHGMVKLTEKQVLAIRAEYAMGKTSTRKLAAKYAISRRSIMFIIRREQWTHI